MSSLTKNQHYVWRHYLDGWTTQKKLWCKRTDKPEPFPTSPRNVGAQRFFYESVEITREDRENLDRLISLASNQRLRDLNQGWVDSFQMTFKIRRMLEKKEIDALDHEELEKLLRRLEQTLGEDFHAATERRAIPILKCLRNEDSSFYENVEVRNDFINYLSHQYFRTARMRNVRVDTSVPSSFDGKRTWTIEAFIFATNLASSLVGDSRRYRIVFLRNKSEVPLITGDQPVINLLEHEIEDVDLYYPLKPDLAIVFTANHSSFPLDYVDIGVLQVEAYNHRMYVMSDSQIYGDDPSYLKAVAALPKEKRF